MELLADGEVSLEGFQNDFSGKESVANEEEAEEKDSGLLGIKPNRKNKTKVNSIVKALKKNKEGKIDTSHITVGGEFLLEKKISRNNESEGQDFWNIFHFTLL